MPVKRKSTEAPRRWYRGASIPMRVIRRFARDVAGRFQPDKIILFGSYAYGTPHDDSDVDVLVIMPARNQIDQAFKIHVTIDPPFPVHVVVRTPHNMNWRLKEGDPFLREVVEKGKVLFEKADAGMGQESGGRLPRRGTSASKRASGSRRGLLPLPTVGRKVPERIAVRKRANRPTNP